MVETSSKQKSNKFYIAGILILAIGLQFANYGTAIVLPTKLRALDGLSFYALAAALGTVGTMLVLPMVGKLNQIFGMRTIILTGIAIQLVARSV